MLAENQENALHVMSIIDKDTVSEGEVNIRACKRNILKGLGHLSHGGGVGRKVLVRLGHGSQVGWWE